MRSCSVKLCLCVLEDRLAPANGVGAIASTSYNWSGYVIQAAPYSVQMVTGSWRVPAVSGNGNLYQSQWVGIDGFGTETVEQIGTSSEVREGKPKYYSWYEFFPDVPVTINKPTRPGDWMTATVTMDPRPEVSYTAPNGGGYLWHNPRSMGFTLALRNRTAGWSFSVYFGRYTDTVMASSAEWVVEAPLLVYSNGATAIATLPNFGTTTFFDCKATIGGGLDERGLWQLTPAKTGNFSTPYLGGLTALHSLNMLNINKPNDLRPIATTGPWADSAAGSTFSIAYGNKQLAVQTKAKVAPKPPPSFRLPWNSSKRSLYPAWR